MIKLGALFLILFFWHQNACGQNILNLENHPVAAINSVINIECPEKLENRILKSRGVKTELKTFKLYVNDSLMNVKSCNTRGNNSLKFRRKSFSITFQKEEPLMGMPLHKIAVNNLCMDRNYWRNRFCFLLMKDIGVFPLINYYTELRLNGKTQGTYLLIQKPEDYVRSADSPLLLRTNYEGKYEEEYSDSGKELMKTFQEKDRLAQHLKGEELFNDLSKIFDTQSYFKWLAFNFLVMNGDYTDEIFFFYKPEERRFCIIPWDFDDVFAAQPHEGWQKRNARMQRQLIFSSESSFDRSIDHDTFLYKKYLETFQVVVEVLTPEKIQNIFEQVYNELYPFYSDDNLISQSRYDLSGYTDLEKLKEDLNASFNLIMNRRMALVKMIEDEIRNLPNN